MQKHFFIWDNPRDAVIWITLMLFYADAFGDRLH